MLQLAGIAVDPLSVGGVETCIQLPGYKLAFDIGRCPRTAVFKPTVLFTHAHMDHIGGIAFHAATRGMLGMEPPTYLVPHENVKGVAALFNAYRRLDRSRLAHNVVPIGPGESYTLPCGLDARPFRSPHRIPCQGYGLWTKKKKLKAEYQGLSGPELRRLRVEDGVEITEVVEWPEVAFTGDTVIDVVEREETVRRARLLIMECTFVDDAVSVKQCRSKGHVHLEEFAERAALFENDAILMTHFSARYRPRDILRALDRVLPPGLRERVTPLLDGHTLERPH
jgi:ribonuclease Z